MCLYVEYETVRFIAKYNAIKDVLDHNAAPPDVDSSAEGDEEDHEAEQNDSHEHDGQEGQDAHETHDVEHEAYDGHEDGDYDEHGEDETEAEVHDDEHVEEHEEHEETYHNEEHGEPGQADPKLPPQAGAVPQEESSSSDLASTAREAASGSVQEPVHAGGEAGEAGEHIVVPAGEIAYDEGDEFNDADNDDETSDADEDTFGIDAAARHVESKADMAVITTPLGDITSEFVAIVLGLFRDNSDLLFTSQL